MIGLGGNVNLRHPRAEPGRGYSLARRTQNGISSSMSLLRVPVETARRGAAVDGPAEPKSLPWSSDPKLPAPPPLRPSSIVSAELKPCNTTSVEYFSTPL